MQPHVERPHQSTGDPDECENEEFLGIERKLHGEVGDEHRGYGLLSLEPNSEQTEHRGATDGREESSPVVSHREVDGRYLDAEEYAADRGGEARGHTHGAGGREHLAVPALVLVDALETRDQLRQQGRHYAGYVDERTWNSEIIQ